MLPSYPPTPTAPADPGPLPAEPPRWYYRYCLYRDLGPSRTLKRAFHATGKPAHRRPGHAWYTAAATWQWADRAAAWDAEQRRILVEAQHERRLDARFRRQSMLNALLEQTYTILLTLKLDALDPRLLADLLPTLHHLFRDLLAAEQREYELSPLAETPPITSEDLRRAYQELQTWQAAGTPARDFIPAPPYVAPESQKQLPDATFRDPTRPATPTP